MNSMRAILNTGRTAEQGIGMEIGKTSKEYYDKVAIALLNEEDMNELGLKENASVKISTKFGFVVVRCKRGRLDRSNVFMPLGPWANLVIGADTGGTGMPLSKGVKVEISKTEDEMTSLDKVLEVVTGS